MPSVNYDALSTSYARHRRPDPRIAAQIVAALGDARRILNVGAGTGSYEPQGRKLVALDASYQMLARRGQRDGGAAALPQPSSERPRGSHARPWFRSDPPR